MRRPLTVYLHMQFAHIKSEILRGDPKECITDYCRMSNPAYLITGSRGFGAVKR